MAFVLRSIIFILFVHSLILHNLFYQTSVPSMHFDRFFPVLRELEVDQNRVLDQVKFTEKPKKSQRLLDKMFHAFT